MGHVFCLWNTKNELGQKLACSSHMEHPHRVPPKHAVRVGQKMPLDGCKITGTGGNAYVALPMDTQLHKMEGEGQQPAISGCGAALPGQHQQWPPLLLPMPAAWHHLPQHAAHGTWRYLNCLAVTTEHARGYGLTPLDANLCSLKGMAVRDQLHRQECINGAAHAHTGGGSNMYTRGGSICRRGRCVKYTRKAQGDWWGPLQCLQ
jgi:hypothetical protein